MQKRKILFISMLAIFAILIVGSASAFDLGSLLGDSSSESTGEQGTIAGLNFTIPEGYKEDPSAVFKNVTQTVGSVSFTMDGQSFENKNGDSLAILVADYGDYNVTDDILNDGSSEKKTINGIDGYIKKDDGFTVFSYEENGDLVSISTSDENVIEEVLA